MRNTILKSIFHNTKSKLCWKQREWRAHMKAWENQWMKNLGDFIEDMSRRNPKKFGNKFWSVEWRQRSKQMSDHIQNESKRKNNEGEPTTIYLWSKVVCLFCFVCPDEIHQTGMLQITFFASLEEGCVSLVSWRLDLWCRRSWILNDFFTEN